MRWLLVKDLRILGRSRLLLALLIVYPLAIAVLIGLAISRSPSRPRVAILDQTPPGETVPVGGQRVLVSHYTEELFSQVQAVRVDGRAEALARVRSGDVIAAVLIPADLAAKVSSLEAAAVEVLYNGNALEQSIVQSTLDSAIARANTAFSEQIQRAAANVLDALLSGGNAAIVGAPPELIGLKQIPGTLSSIIARQPPGRDRSELQRIEAFAGFAAENLLQSRNILATVGQPIHAHSRLLSGRRTPLNAFAVVVAANISLMFVCVLLAAGGVALEREEHALGRLLRGLVSRETLLGEKALLAAGCSFLLALALLAGVGAFVTLRWGRIDLWIAALAFGAVAFGGLGVAIGALAREVRAATLLAILLSLPLALLALVPAGSVSHGFYDAIGVVSFAFPFKASLEALDTAVNGASPGLLGSLAHLLGLTVVFGCLARLGLRAAD